MEAKLQRVEVESSWRRNHDLAVHDDAGRDLCEDGVVHVGKVPIERLQIAALDVDVIAAAKDDRAKAVPLRLVQERSARRQRVGQLCEHRLDRRHDGNARPGIHDDLQGNLLRVPRQPGPEVLELRVERTRERDVACAAVFVVEVPLVLEHVAEIVGARKAERPIGFRRDRVVRHVDPEGFGERRSHLGTGQVLAGDADGAPDEFRVPA